MDVITNFVVPIVSILVGLVAIFISIRNSRSTTNTLEEIKKSIDKRVSQSIKSLEDANKYIRESSLKVQTDLIDLIRDSKLPNDQLTSHVKSDFEFIISNLDSLDCRILRACEKFPGCTPRFKKTSTRKADLTPKSSKEFSNYLGPKSREEVEASISKLIGFELVDYFEGTKKPIEMILKLTQKGIDIIKALKEKNLIPE